MDAKYGSLNKLFVIADALDFEDGGIEMGYALPASNAAKFLEGVASLAKSLGGVCYVDLSFDELNKITEAAISQRNLKDRGLCVISSLEPN